MRLTLAALIAGFSVMATAMPASAHHSFAAEFVASGLFRASQHTAGRDRVHAKQVHPGLRSLSG